MFHKAEKTDLKLRLAISGASGAGKTYSALSIASHLSTTGRIALLDTERASSLKYADTFDFDVCHLDDFHPIKYIESIKEAENSGHEILIIDSLTHAWFKELELAENKFSGWRNVRPLERKLIDAMIGSKCHIIATMRSRTEWLIEESQKNGKNTYNSPKKIGTSPIQSSGIEYEFDVAGEMDWNHILTISKSRCPAITDKTYLNPGQELAEDLKKWLNSGRPLQSPPLTTTSPLSTIPIVNTHNQRVKEVRLLLEIEQQSIIQWLKDYGVTEPSQLEPHNLEHLIEWMAATWGEHKGLDFHHILNSFRQHIPTLINQGLSEVEAITSWKEHIQLVESIHF